MYEIICEKCKKSFISRYKINRNGNIRKYCSIECSKVAGIGTRTKEIKLNKYIINGNMVTIYMRDNKEMIIDVEDLQKVINYHWFPVKGRKTYYAKANHFGCRVWAHRIILGNKISAELNQIDHINHNGLDNRKCNLRLCNNQQNHFNISKRRCNTTSQYKGVSWSSDRNKWMACIALNGKTKNLGRFDNEIDAAKAYNEASKQYFGEFANLNKIEEGNVHEKMLHMS